MNIITFTFMPCRISVELYLGSAELYLASDKSLIFITKRKGLSTLPCDTPVFFCQS